jgi:hypothetical protein
MQLILMGLGIASVVAGAAMLGFGISYNEFGTGNSFIGAGTTALIGGLVLVGIAVAVGQLTRIAKVLEPGGVGRPALPIALSAAAAQAPLGKRVEPVAVAAEPLMAEETRPEPPLEASAAAPLAAAATAEPSQPVPTTPARLATKPRTGEPAAPAAEADNSRPPRGVSRSEIPVVLSPRERGFDTVWPAEHVGGEASGARGSSPTAGDAVPLRAERSPPAVTILKSGVIDGMAYTLYSDGSIEAELPQGVVRFATIEELRDHLGNNA